MTSSAQSPSGTDSSRNRQVPENPTRPSSLHHQDRKVPRAHHSIPALRAHADPLPANRAGRRPSDRRSLIIAAAAELFYEFGFQNVSMGNIGKAVGVGPSALYRHFASKNALLGAVLFATFEEQKTLLQTLARSAQGRTARRSSQQGFGPDNALRDGYLRPPDFSAHYPGDQYPGEQYFGDDQARCHPDEVETVIRYASEMSLANRRAGVLWQQNSHYLAEVDLTLLRAKLRNMLVSYAQLLQIRRPSLTALQAEFLAVASTATQTSLSFHHHPIDPAGVVELLVGWGTALADLNLPVESATIPAYPAQLPPLAPADMETVLSQAAVSLLADNGHWPGRAVIELGGNRTEHNHFAAKGQIIRTAVISGFNRLQLELDRTERGASQPAQTLDRLIYSYIDRMLAEPYLIDIVIREVPKLAPEARDHARRTQSRYVGQWLSVAMRAHPEWAEKRARLTVTAFMTVVNDVVRSPRPRSMNGIRESLAVVGRSLLDLPQP